MFGKLKEILVPLAAGLALCAVATAQTKITVTGEVSGVIPFVDVDVEVTVDADGTITVDNTGPNVIDPVTIPDWVVPDNMDPVDIDVGTVSEEDAPGAIGGAIAGALLDAYLELLAETIEELVQDFLDWFDGILEDFDAWWNSSTQDSSTSGGNDTTEVSVRGGLDDDFAAQIVAGIASAFQAWLDDNG